MEMYDNHLLDNMVKKASLIDESTEETEVIDLAGYQVTKADKYLKIAADDGDSECQWAIGEMLIDGEVDGEGVDADEEEGVKWLEKSARGGHKEAKKSLEERRGASNN